MTENAMTPWTRERVLDLLDHSDAAVVRGLKAIFARQTADEQSDGTTRHRNARGFAANDAEILSDIAKKLPRYHDRMTVRQTAFVRKRLKRYWRQLLEEVELAGRPVIWPAGARRQEQAQDDEVAAERRDEQRQVESLEWDPEAEGAWA
jgi:hypothetical protein